VSVARSAPEKELAKEVSFNESKIYWLIAELTGWEPRRSGAL